MEITLRRKWNSSMLSCIKRRELSTVARRFAEVQIQKNEEKINELMSEPVHLDLN